MASTTKRNSTNNEVSDESRRTKRFQGNPDPRRISEESTGLFKVAHDQGHFIVHEYHIDIVRCSDNYVVGLFFYVVLRYVLRGFYGNIRAPTPFFFFLLFVLLFFYYHQKRLVPCRTIHCHPRRMSFCQGYLYRWV